MLNDRVNEEDILSGHFQATRDRFASSTGFIFVLHDTTEFSFQRERPDLIGVTYNVNSGRDKAGRIRSHTVCGILIHSSLAVTSEGLPLGLAAVKFWTRKKFKGTAALKKKVNLTRIPIEKKESIRWLENLKQSTATLGDPARCVHIGDRESDIYELFCTAQEIGTHFLIRTCVDRLAGDGNHTVADEMKRAKIRGQHRLAVRDADANPDVAVLEIKYERIRLLPPIGKQKQYPSLELTVIHAQERGKPLRWKIELFHKILKSGCKAEESKLRTAERLVNLISIFCIVSWRIFWMTMLNRTAPNAPPNLALTATEMRLLDHLVPDKHDAPDHKSVSRYITQDSQAWRLSRPRQRSGSGQHCHVARIISPDRHRVGRACGAKNCG